MKNKETQLASLKLLHAVINEKSNKNTPLADITKYGIIPLSSSGILTELNTELANLIIDTLGIKSIEWTQTFHKSWDKVATAPEEQLVAEQILNYFSTYGLESLGFDALNYVPIEKILINIDKKPALESFTVVKILTKKELNNEIVKLIQTMKSPQKDLICDIKQLLTNIKQIDLNTIKSFEIKTMYCDIHKITPSDPQDFLRFAIYKATYGKTTTVVKDKKTIEVLKTFANNTIIEQMFENADLKKLSESFHRFKPLFLAFKQNKRLANKINKIRRLAITNHKPISGFSVANVMNLLTLNNKKDAIKIIEKADTRELIKLINFANYETTAKDHIYNIRNGKIFVKVEENENNINIIRMKNLIWLSEFCKNKLKSLLNNAFNGLTFYIPETIDYAVPVSEKQMMGILPYGTKIILPEDAKALCIGGHWFNTNKRIDLDFHLNSLNQSFGWNSNFRDDNNNILYSGDMTDAPKPLGAAEVFRISNTKGIKDAYFLSVIGFNTSNDDEIPFDLIITKDIIDICNFKSRNNEFVSAVINPENAISPKISLTLHSKEELIGFYYKNAFTIYGGELGKKHCIPRRDLINNVLKTSLEKCNSMMRLKEFIELAGGKVVHSQDEAQQYIDLSLKSITTSTLFNVIALNKDNMPLE